MTPEFLEVRNMNHLTPFMSPFTAPFLVLFWVASFAGLIRRDF
jgi:hypothetical protein